MEDFKSYFLFEDSIITEEIDGHWYVSVLVEEDSAFKKAREHPYHIVGQFHPSKYDRKTIKHEFHHFMKQHGYSKAALEAEDIHGKPYDKAESSAHIDKLFAVDPDSKEHKELLKNRPKYSIKQKFDVDVRTPKETRNTQTTYHQDFGNNTKAAKQRQGQMVATWSNSTPTKIRTLKGKDVGHDIKPHDVVIIHNRKSVHTTPSPEDNRWFARMYAKRDRTNPVYKKLQKQQTDK